MRAWSRPTLRRNAWLLVRRELRGGMMLAIVALWVGLIVTSTVGALRHVLDREVGARSAELLGGDVVYSASFPLPDDVQEAIRAKGATGQSNGVQLLTTVSTGEQWTPVSLRAVDESWPLFGHAEVDRGNGMERLSGSELPAGSLWMQQEQADLLDIEPGSTMRVGVQSFRVDGLLIREPDRMGGTRLALAPKAIMKRSDFESTGLVGPAIRARYTTQVRADASTLDALRDMELDDTISVTEPGEGESQAAGQAKSLLSVLSYVALGLAMSTVFLLAAEWIRRQRRITALLRCFGATLRQARALIAAQIALLTVLVCVPGAILSEIAGRVALHLAKGTQFFTAELSFWEALLARQMPLLLTALVLLCAGLPIAWRIGAHPPMAMLRPTARRTSAMPKRLLAAGVVVGLGTLWWFAGGITSSLIAVMATASIVAGVVSLIITRLLPSKGHLAVRLAALSVKRRTGGSAIFSGVMAVLLSLTGFAVVLSNEVIDQWETVVPADAPNHFAWNVLEHERDGFEAALRGIGATTSPFYPMTRARISEINGDEYGRPAREYSLSWSTALPRGNEIIDGEWWDSDPQQSLVSFDEGAAEFLGLAVGDLVVFTIGGIPVEAAVASFREVDWESMQPNFWIILSPGAAEGLSSTYLGSFHAPDGSYADVASVLAQYPTVTLLDVGALVQDYLTLAALAAQGVAILLTLTLPGAGLALAALFVVGAMSRRRETALLRAMGASKLSVLLAYLLEVSLLALSSGLVAAGVAELGLLALSYTPLEIERTMHASLWIALPSAAVLVSLIASVQPIRKVAGVPPAQVLRTRGAYA